VRGNFRIYLGAAPGVGKTFAMLAEGRRRSQRGCDVVVGLVETHGRARTVEAVEGLEVIPRRNLIYRGHAFTEMDTDAVIRRAPALALVDELAHTNVPGSAHEKRWQEIERLLDAGIDVISTVNIQHLESVNDVVEQITGIPQRETIPDEVVRRANQVELVDMAPEALRRRMAHGNIYSAEKVDAALSKYFRVGNLTALRELALLWLVDKVDDQLHHYRADHGIGTTWEARERVVVALTGGPEGETLIRRASRIAARSRGADLVAVHVIGRDGLTRRDPAMLARQRTLVESLGGTYHQVVGDDIAEALLQFARGVNATQLVLGASRRGRFAQFFSRGVGAETTAMSDSIDVHVVKHGYTHTGGWSRRMSALGSRRRYVAFVLGVAGMPLLTLLLANLRDQLSLPSDILMFLAGVVGVTLVGGLYPGLLTALLGFLLLDYYFTPPIHSFRIAGIEDIEALTAYLVVAATVAIVVDTAARRTREAASASAEAAVLATLSGSVLRGGHSAQAILEQLRQTYALSAVTLLERPPDTAATPGRRREPQRWRVAATTGDRPCSSPEDSDTEIPIDDGLVLALRGHLLTSADRRVLEAFAAQAAVALHHRQLHDEADKVHRLEESDRLHTDILSAVSHDLCAPLASAKAAVDSIGTPGLQWSAADHRELVGIAAESLGKLDRLVANLIDMSRLRSGVLAISRAPVAIEEVLPRTLDRIGSRTRDVQPIIAPDLPEALADPGLLERVLDNLISNALSHSDDAKHILITASGLIDTVEIRVIDTGPGAPPFQRSGDHDNYSCVDNGLAVARGLAEAMGGHITPEETPGGGVTMVLTLPTATYNVDENNRHEDQRATDRNSPANRRG